MGRTLGELVWGVVRVVSLLLWRYLFTGHPLIGDRRDNATFLYAATQDMRGKPYEKLSDAIWKRLARRWAAVGVPLLLVVVGPTVGLFDPAWARVDWPKMAVCWWVGAAAVLATWGTRRFVLYMRTREVTNEFVYPAWEAACDAMGYKFRTAEARRMVELPAGFKEPGAPEKRRSQWTAWFHRWRDSRRDTKDTAEEISEETAEPTGQLVPVSTKTEVATYKPPPWALLRRRHGSHADESDPVVVHLPPGKCATDAEKKRLIQKVGPLLGMPDATPNWDRRMRWVELRPAHQPPPEFTFAEFRKYLDHPDVDIDHIPIGLSHNGRLEFLNFIDDTAHVLISAMSGRGKSNLIKLIGALFMHFGALVLMLDFKLVSHRWAHNLPGCEYAWEIPHIHESLLALGKEIHLRKQFSIPSGGDVDTPLNRFQTLVVFVEEVNALSDQLRDYWASIRKPNQPAQSPALAAYREAIYTGREFGVRLFPIAQRASAATFGTNGGDARENFGSIIMGGWTLQAWKMLARGLPFVLCPPGRGVFSVLQSDGRAPVLRTPLITDREARDVATSGVPAATQVFLDHVVIQDGSVVEPVTPTEPLIPELVDLRTAAEGNMLPGPAITWEAIRKASQRVGKIPFPEPEGMIGTAAGYRLADLIEWKNAKDGVRPPLSLVDGEARRGVIYQFNTLDPDMPGEIEIGYIGKTRQRLSKREDQHRGDKPWADLIVGSPLILWQSDACTDEELSQAEQDAIERWRPRYNYEFQEGAPHATPLPEQVRQRQARQQARRLPPWEPEDRYEMSQAALMSHAGTG